jgi:cytochrome c2
MPNQYNYSRIAGGDTTIATPNDIKEAFNGASAHQLDSIQSFIRNKWNFSNTLADNNPCSGCHNPHRAKRDPHTTAGRTDGSGNLILSSVSLPSQHNKDNTLWYLWGDDAGERMSNYATNNFATYQAPYRYNSSTTYEPDGSSTISNGSNLFDTVTFCLDCHSQSAGGRAIINWGSTGDLHGSAIRKCCDYGDKLAPCNETTNYVLSCLDCHEPHGSPNPMLLRQEVNGTNVGIFAGSAYWNFCSACHTIKTAGIMRSEERRVGKECRRLCRSRWSPYH